MFTTMKYSVWRFFIFFFGIIYFIEGKKTCIPDVGKHCKCSRDMKWIKCYSLNYIPRLPRTTVNLTLVRNTLPFIQRQTFSNISSIQIVSMVFIINNSIRYIDNDSFVDMKLLKYLGIRHECKLNVSSLQASFQSLNTGLQTLLLPDNGWARIKNDTFVHLSKSSINTLILDNNNLAYLQSSVFKYLSKLQTLRLIGNEIAYIYIYEMNLLSLKILDLSDNNIFHLPSFCGNRNASNLLPRLKWLSLKNNAIRHIYPEEFKCLNSLEFLYMDGNRLRILGNNIFSALPRLHTFSVSFMDRLSKIEPEAFNCSSLTKFLFTGNGFRFDKRTDHYDQHTIFRFLPKLQDLNLEQNYLPKDISTLNDMLLPLHTLRKINMATTGLSKIPEMLLRNNPYLEDIILGGNKISKWDASTFENVTSLRKLHLYGNQIHLINESSFSERFLKAVHKLDLSDNPFWCTCDQRWFLQKLRNTNITSKMTSWPWRYDCYYPEHLLYTEISKYFPTDAECSPLRFVFFVIISVSSSVIVLFLFIIITFGCQINIKNALYLLRINHRVKNGYVKVKCSGEFDFDAFIVYCSEDRQWVHNVLLKQLDLAGLNTCIHFRDFEAGMPITDNIEKYMAKSWKIIVVMSNEFAKSEWCQLELDFVHERRRQQGKEALVLIMYRSIDSKHMTSPIRTLLRTTPYLTFKKGFGEKLFWKAIVQDAKQPLRLPPTALV